MEKLVPSDDILKSDRFGGIHMYCMQNNKDSNRRIADQIQPWSVHVYVERRHTIVLGNMNASCVL